MLGVVFLETGGNDTGGRGNGREEESVYRTINRYVHGGEEMDGEKGVG